VRLARCEVIDPGEEVLLLLPGSWWSFGVLGSVGGGHPRLIASPFHERLPGKAFSVPTLRA